MVFLASALIVAGFAAGVVLVQRFAPPLADTREGRLVFWLVALLVGASAALIVDNVWIAVRALTSNSNALAFGDSREGIMVSGLRNLLFDAAPTLALAAILHQLGPGATDEARSA